MSGQQAPTTPFAFGQLGGTGDPAVTDASYELLGRLRLAARLERRGEVPRLAEDAYHGLAGDIVHSLEPLTEASGPAMLLTLLVTYSAMAGQNAFVYVGPKKHYPLLYGVVIGRSARDRKGTSAAAVRPVIDAADTATPFMTERQIRGGIQSGEALIQAAVGSSTAGATSSASPDQRLLVVEEEYARLLTVAGREGSTLSTTLRSAWDSDVLSARTKTQALTAEHAHVAVLGQVTTAELTKLLKPVDVTNGYANRFLHVLSHRTCLLPEPGRLPDQVVGVLGGRLREAIDFAHGGSEIMRSAAFTRAWDRLYRVVESQPSGGMVYDSLTARASAYQLRLALVYALLDRSETLEEVHLRAAAALWDYCEASVAHIWGATLGSPRLDKLYTALAAAGPTGLDRTQINGVFSNNLRKDQLDALEFELLDMGLAIIESQSTGGRPRQVLSIAS
ncbi:DUF3987 domain-containing protein [Nocardioides sp. AX2bis]|uniref:DUF3987 domain-containing protein n=1 Tax=Nocardioides sp. AX2bis TaxID=2653157 RepID=UPI0012F36427|nr:DUF3987 domain-containing protein [Nocardioides sp. AX2bis]VXB08114.1 conserved hypothetical protein [Nocardioides sp. AX2bis]